MWTFNSGGAEQMDYGAEACTIDYDENTLFCGTNQPTPGQHSLWAINVLDGQKRWSVDAGSIRTRPHIGFGAYRHVLVGDATARVRAIDRDTQAIDWTYTVSTAPGAFIANNVWGEHRPPWRDHVLVTDSTGAVTLLIDNGTSASLANVWTFGTAKAMSGAMLWPTQGHAYVGLDDGTVHQLDLATLLDEAVVLASHTNAPHLGNIVVQPSLMLEGAGVEKIIVSSAGTFGTTVKKLCVPFQ